VAAFQAINFGVVARALGPGLPRALPIVLFGISWGLHECFLAAASPAMESVLLAFAGGGAIGLTIGTLSWVVRRWPGGYLAAGALHFLVVYLVLGFLS
jgi:hypothetical protein